MYVSIYKRSARVSSLPSIFGAKSWIAEKVLAERIYPSALNVVNTADSYQELFMTVRSFKSGQVDVYDLENGMKVGTLFPSGRISLRYEYVGREDLD